MKKLELNQMENLNAFGPGRQCLIDGALTSVSIALGFWSGGPAGSAIAFVGGLFAANSNGCFN